MSIASVLKRLTKALPAVLAAAPGVIEAVNQVKEALKTPRKPDGGGAEGRGRQSPLPASPSRLSADSAQGPR